MTGRMYLTRAVDASLVHAAVVFQLESEYLIFEDLRRFGRFQLDNAVLAGLGPEPLEPGFSVAELRKALRRSAQTIKVRLLDQSVVAGIGNIYASEILFQAQIDPRRPARSLDSVELRRLHRAIKRVLSDAIRFGSTIPLDFAGHDSEDNLFYFGQSTEASGRFEERLRVYDREGERCRCCKRRIQRITQGARSTYFCPRCQS